MSAVELAQDLSAIAGLFRDPLETADGVLLGVGDGLSVAVEAFGRLTDAFETLPRQLDGEDLRQACDHLTEVAAAAASMAASLADEEQVLARLRGSIGRVGSSVTKLRGTVGVIALLSVNARIAAAHLSKGGEDFSVFTQQVTRLAKTVEGTVGDLDRDHAGLDLLLRSAQVEQDTFRRRYGQSLADVAERLDAEFDLFRAHRARSATLAATIGERSGQIASRIGAAVMSLQIGDRTRQRLDHVAQALDLLMEDDQWDGAGATVCLLQAAQVGQAADEFADETRRTSEALRRLSLDAAALVDLGADMLGSDGGAGGSFLDRLRDRIATVSALMTECQTARRKVDHVTESLSRTLGDLVRRAEAVRTIETDMRLIGLNAAFKCGRLGDDGRTLSAIAHELRGYASQIVEDARLLMVVLQEVMADSAILDRQRRDQSARSISVLEARIGSSLSKLGHGGDRLSSAMAALAGEGRHVSASLADNARRIITDTRLDQPLRAAVDWLERIAIALPTSQSDRENRALAQIAARYTMASERRIHERFSPSTAPIETEDALADIFF
jgi:hypothetical protein